MLSSNLLLRLSVAEHRQQDFLSHPTHSQEMHCAQLPEITNQHTSHEVMQQQHHTTLNNMLNSSLSRTTHMNWYQNKSSSSLGSALSSLNQADTQND